MKNHIWPWKGLSTLKLTLDQQNYTIHSFSGKIPCKRGITHVPIFIWQKLYFCLFDLEIVFLTLKMTLSHQNNTRNGLLSQNHMKMRYYTCSWLYLLKNHIWPWNIWWLFCFSPKKFRPRMPKWHPADSCSGHPLEPESIIKHRPYRETRLSKKMPFDNWTKTRSLGNWSRIPALSVVIHRGCAPNCCNVWNVQCCLCWDSLAKLSVAIQFSPTYFFAICTMNLKYVEVNLLTSVSRLC